MCNFLSLEWTLGNQSYIFGSENWDMKLKPSHVLERAALVSVLDLILVGYSH